jgi:hypothetical protein
MRVQDGFVIFLRQSVAASSRQAHGKNAALYGKPRQAGREGGAAAGVLTVSTGHP